MKIARKDFDIISDILTDCKLTELENFPVCYKQIEGHFRIFATRWKYENIHRKKTDKQIESAFSNAKANFVDLAKPGVLANFLMKNSNRDDYI